MSCGSVTLSAIDSRCDATKGGIKQVWAFQKNEIATKTLTDSIYTALTLTASAQLYPYTFRNDSGSLTSTYTIDNNTGVKYVTNVLSLKFPKMQTSKRVSLTALANGELCFIVLDKNGIYWALGFEENDDAMMISSGEGSTGTAIGDGNFYTIEFSGTSEGFPFEISASVVNGLLNPTEN